MTLCSNALPVISMVFLDTASSRFLIKIHLRSSIKKSWRVFEGASSRLTRRRSGLSSLNFSVNFKRVNFCYLGP